MTAKPSPDGTGQRLYREARTIIPGGVQLLSKRPEMYAPDIWPAYYQSAAGCEVVDLDGNRYIDMSNMAVGAAALGYADPDVTAAVVDRIRRGSICTLNAPEEVALARALINLHPWAQQVRYARTGGEAMAVAVRIARAATRRDIIAFCGYHGWSDWYLAANLASSTDKTDGDALRGHLLPGLDPLGVPAQLAGTMLPFRYNAIDELRAIVKAHGRNLAAVVMEPVRYTDPTDDFLHKVRALCDDSGARLVFDEITIGWRLNLGGAHLRLGVEPDVAVFGKTLGNGHPMAAIIGRATTMDAAQDSFISSSYWTEAVGPTAALAFIEKAARIDLPAHTRRIGERLRAAMTDTAARHGVPVKAAGYPACQTISLDVPDADAQAALQTLMNIRMLERGVLWSGQCVATYGHRDEHVDAVAAAADEVYAELAAAIAADDALQRIGGRVKHAGFARLT